MITHHTQLLNALAEKYHLDNYIEIGTQNCENNFNKIRCANKVGVDPDPINADYRVAVSTSDDFFKSANGDNRYQLAFIDGWHSAEQVDADFLNILKYLDDDGFILIHDTLPENESGTLIPRIKRQWWGTVYQWAMGLHKYGYEFKTFNIDNGCTLVQKKPIVWNGDEYRNMPSPIEPTWENFLIHGKALLRVTDIVEI